jgi:hypothetical protein
MNNLLFAKATFSPIDKEKAASDILNVDKKYWFWDEYRGLNMLSLMTRNPVPGPDGTKNNVLGDFQWLDYTPSVIVDWFENEIFPWMGRKTRIMALLTYPGIKSCEHIDCDDKDIGTQQHKFRFVLRGNTNTLYFKTENGDVYAPDISEAFLMDGGWPHGMDNKSDTVKLTIAAGAPWNGNDHYTNVEVLLKKSDFVFPLEYKKYLKTKNV